jgi:hypothetical protein
MVLPSDAGCGVGGIRGRDPGQAAINREIDLAAARRRVPPYLLKAIAWQESKWRQFYSDGSLVLSGSCAIGVMQVLASGGFDRYKLATDYRYNVDAGAQVLAAKMSASSANVPRSLGSDDRRVAENWYRATYRYNGSGYRAMRYADAVFATVARPPAEIARWTLAVSVVNPRSVIPNYTPTSGHSYVARIDGTWVSTLGTYRHAVVRGDVLAGAAVLSPGTTLEGDQTAGALFRARNLGWVTWEPSHVSLSTYPIGRASRLRSPRWLTSTRPVALYRTTPPGAEGRFYFPVQAYRPSSSVSIAEPFVPVYDGWTSMAARAYSSWTIHPARSPVASVASAPAYVTDASTDSTAPVSLSFSDPSPGSGVAWVEVSRLAPGATSWVTTRVTSATPRLAFSGAGAHEVRVRAADRAGHVSAWSASRRVVVPRDDTHASLAFSGDWAPAEATGSWLGTLAGATLGSSVTTTVTGTSYALIGTRGPGLAPLTVYLDGALVTVADTAAESFAQRRVLWSAALAEGDHTLRVVVGDDTLSRRDAADEAPAWAYLDAVAVA